MGTGTERYTAGSISRAAQDEFAAASHERAAEPTKNGRLADEISPVAVPQRRGDPILVTEDEGIRSDTTPDSLGALRPAFDPDGTITAGNASQISDGGSALVLMSSAEADRRGVECLGEFVSFGMVAGPDNPSLLLQPSNAIRAALSRTDLSVADLDLIEINEAFAAVGIASTADLGLDPDIVNVNGGAVGLGHPLAATGTRLVLTLAHELQRCGGRYGVATACIGGGQGIAMVIESIKA